LIYNSKIEEIKSEIYNKKSEFDLMGIFEIYDEEQKGFLSTSEFIRFMEDFNVIINKELMYELLLYINRNLNNKD